MVFRIWPVQAVSATGAVDALVYRNDRIPAAQSGSIAVLAARTDLAATGGITMRSGSWVGDGFAELPLLVVGSTARPRPSRLHDTSTCGCTRRNDAPMM